MAVAYLLFASASSAATVADVRTKMGSRFEIKAVHADPEHARRAIDRAWAEIDRIESMISSWQATSETSEVNRQAGKAPVEVSRELFDLVRRALKVSALTGGAFDITFAGVGKLWDFKSIEPQVPDADAIAEAIHHIDWRRVKLDPAARTIFLEDPGARMGFGAIGKGYAANRAAIVLKAEGIESGVINAGGDLLAYGMKEDGAPWDIGVLHPRDRSRLLAHLPLSETAVVTSGDYESYFLIDGKRYAHILDPRTGYPVSELISVTVVCPDAELADALATGLFVLGPEEGMVLVERLDGIEALMVGADGTVHLSTHLRSDHERTEPSP